MNETLLWLLYCIGGVLAFAAVYYWRWRIILAILPGGLVTGAGWALLYRLTDEEKRPDWVQLDLSLNLCFALIFACFGAVLGWWLRNRRGGAD
ncbi:MAG: hypothetical protein ACJ8EM_09425 [Sphingomicrobium sp.]